MCVVSILNLLPVSSQKDRLQNFLILTLFQIRGSYLDLAFSMGKTSGSRIVSLISGEAKEEEEEEDLQTELKKRIHFWCQNDKSEKKESPELFFKCLWRRRRYDVSRRSGDVSPKWLLVSIVDKMTKAYKLNWHIPVPQELQDGALCDRWTEVIELNFCTLSIPGTGSVEL